MKHFIAKGIAFSGLVLAGVISQAGAQASNEPQAPSPAQQQYQYQQRQPSPDQRQNQLQQQADSGIARQRSYDPNAGLHSYENHRSLKEQINPCNRNYGIVMDGWHDAGLLYTVKSLEWWLAFILFIALVGVGFDDLHRKMRAKDMREAAAGAFSYLLNERNYCWNKANDAIYRHNQLILKGDALAREADARGQVETQTVRQSMASPTADHGAALEVEHAPTVPTPTSQVAPLVSSSEPEDEIQGDQSVIDGEDDDARQVDSSDEVSADAARLVAFDLGGKKIKIPIQAHLLINSLRRKVENQRMKINQMEERLSQYEKD